MVVPFLVGFSQSRHLPVGRHQVGDHHLTSTRPGTTSADDHIVGVKSKEDAEELIYRSSKLLLKYGLNLNAHKVMIQSRLEYIQYWSFEIMDLLGDDAKRDAGKAIEIFLEWKKAGIHFREVTVLRRLLSATAHEVRVRINEISEIILDSEHVAMFADKNVGKLVGHQVNRAKRDEVRDRLVSISSRTLFSSFQLNLLKHANTIGFNQQQIEQIATDLKRVDSL